MRNMQCEELIPLIHNTKTKAVLFITGGGTEVLPMLLKRGGGSATLLSAMVPYANAETIQLLGGTPDKFVSEETARKMAMAAYQKALTLSTDDEPVIGVACSSALQKTPTERAGRIHYIYAALQTGYKTVSLTVQINQIEFPQDWGAVRIREWEETANAELVMNLIAEGCGVECRLFTEYLKPVRRESTIHCGFFPELLNGKIKALRYTPNVGIFLPMTRETPMFLLPGSFNPAHPAHFEMAEYLIDCEFELSIRNVDKPVLDFITIEERLKTCGNQPVWLTNTPTFVEKSKAFPNITFAVGYDTAIRIVNPKYAGSLDEIMAVFEQNNTRFVTFGREIGGVYYAGLDGLPERFKQICTGVEAPLQYRHVSSTEIRNSKF